MRYTLWPAGHDYNETAVAPESLKLALDADAVTGRFPDALRKGRVLLLERQTAAGLADARQAVVEYMDGNRIFLAQPLPDLQGFHLGDTVISANVAPAGHGELKGEKLLGSGNAARLNQEFLLAVPGVSFVADSSMPSGVRADIAIVVDGQIWQQVGSLGDSGSADPHYTVRVTEEGALNIAFGDGRYGRRLPTGSNNVRVTYRVGSGLAGNLPAGSLKQPARPHRLVASVRQPQGATGGNDMESVGSLRATAPASLLTLERAVSLTDFANLAASQSSVVQARAFSRTTSLGRRESIEVVVVPAGGAALDETSYTVNAEALRHFLDQQASFLQDHALPGTSVAVLPYEPILVDVDVSVAIKSTEYNVETTLEAVRAALDSALSLSRRRLGQALHRSELYKAVESVKGVEYSDCRMLLVQGTSATPKPLRVLPPGAGTDAPVETIVPGERQVIYLDKRFSQVRLVAQEFTL
jgi:predicted phage baseplate assembly protein